MRKIWLVSTDHLERELWFRDEEDFKAAMNFVAVQAACSPSVEVMAFILMSNHVHFVLKAEREDVESFIRSFKHRHSIFMNRKWGIKKFLRLTSVDIREIPYDDEAPERAIAYVQMNCVAANICLHPGQYRWGTGNCFFNQSSPSGVPLRDLSARSRERLMHSRCAVLPDSWQICNDDYILPQAYVNVSKVEEIFRTPKRMNFFLNTSSKARKKVEAKENLPAFRDQSILVVLPDLCRSLFQKESFQQLSEEERSEFMRQIRFRFSADIHQIARVCGISYADAARLIDLV